MAIPVIIMGRSGTGKSYSMRTFEEGEIGLINVLGKRLPFRNQIPSVQTFDYNQITDIIGKANAKSIVIDDCGYLITDMFMSRHADAWAGNGVFALYNDIGDCFYKLLRTICTMPDSDEKIVYIVLHEDSDDMGMAKIKTIGKLLDEKVTIEGMVSIVLQSCIMDGQYVFRTNGEGIVKSPPDMFPEYVQNDLKAVDAAIREYWGL